MTRPTIITVLAIILIFLLLGLAGGMDKADAAAMPEGEHHCYAVSHAVGAQPVEVPCDSAPIVVPVEAVAEPSMVIAVPAPIPVVPGFVHGQTIHGPRHSPRKHRRFPATQS
jgi:hypothetical protein